MNSRDCLLTRLKASLLFSPSRNADGIVEEAECKEKSAVTELRGRKVNRLKLTGEEIANKSFNYCQHYKVKLS